MMTSHTIRITLQICQIMLYPSEDSKFFLWEWAKLINTTAQKPLVKILSDLTLNKISVTSIFYLKEQTLAWCFKIIHLSGRNTPVSNTASWSTLELIIESPEAERLAKISSESKIGLLVWYWHQCSHHWLSWEEALTCS